MAVAHAGPDTIVPMLRGRSVGAAEGRRWSGRARTAEQGLYGVVREARFVPSLGASQQHRGQRLDGVCQIFVVPARKFVGVGRSMAG